MSSNICIPQGDIIDIGKASAWTILLIISSTKRQPIFSLKKIYLNYNHQCIYYKEAGTVCPNCSTPFVTEKVVEVAFPRFTNLVD